jgi:dolichol-phosphate mannosyltransferase
MKLLVVIPTYNEATNIAVLVPRLFKWIPGVSVLVVDDGSPDGTAQVVRELKEDYTALHLIERGAKAGLGSAYREGFAWGLAKGFDSLVEMDADLSHRVRDLAMMLQAKNPGVDLVIGSRWMPGGAISNWSKGREMLSRSANRYVQFALNLGVKDATSGFRIYSAEILRRITGVTSEGYSFQIEMTRAVRKLDGAITEVPITFRERSSGVSKMSKAIVIEAMSLVTLWGLQRLLRIK